MPNNQSMEEFVGDLLRNKVPQQYYYHNYEHTLYVIDKVIEIGEHENCSPEEIELLKIAALWHDVGYIHTYIRHEEEGCVLVRQYFPGYGFTDTQIEKICGMIMATKVPQSPKNKLETIIADADLEYLGTGEAAEMANQLFREVQTINPGLTKAGWDKMQVSFLKAHKYFTRYCKEVKEPVKQTYLEGLMAVG